MISTELFPYESFGVRLEVKAENRICWFKDMVDLQKHLDRYKLDKKNLKIDYRDGESVEHSKKHERSVEQKPKSKNNRGAGTGKKRTSRVDSTSNTTRSTKSKK